MMIPPKEELALTIDEAEWGWLKAHSERGGLIVVDDALDLADAAIRVAEDDVETIGRWVSTGRMGKPSLHQINDWDANIHKKFAMLIVSPYILIQEKRVTVH